MILKISASAGSGKTYTLTRRFLELLQNASPEARASGCAMGDSARAYSLAEILAATFTNKAAAEMKNRVVSTLKENALKERAARLERHSGRQLQGSLFETTSSGQAEQWVERILRHYGNLNIRTIDSLLTTLVRLSALELGLPPDFEPSFDPGEFFSPVYDGLMEDLVPEDQAFELPFSLVFGEQPAERTGASFAEKADSPSEGTALRPSPSGPAATTTGTTAGSGRRFLTSDAATLRSALAEACRSLLYVAECRGFTTGGRLHDLLYELVCRLLTGQEVPCMDSTGIHARLGLLHSRMKDACEGLRRSIEREQLKANSHFNNYLAACLDGGPLSALPKSVYASKGEFDECLNKPSRGTASEAALGCFAGFMEASLQFSLVLPVARHALQLAPLTLLAHEIHARILEELRGGRLLPAICLPLLATKVLSGEYGVSDALCRMGTRLSRLLLDEFQDTSREQWAAILPLAAESLSTGGSLTYVGDVKQAIYGWRGGDVKLFDAVPHEPELGAIVPDAREMNLEFNWRSHPRIVLHNNAFFGQLAAEPLAREVLAAMLPDHTPEDWVTLAAREASRGFASVAQKIPAEKHWDRDPGNDKAATRLYLVSGRSVEAVQNLVRRRMQALLTDELLPNWNYADIAVLVRSGQEASLVAEWITNWGFPVVTENSFLLASHPMIGELMSFLSFLDYPLDDLAFWEFAGSPECLGRVCGLHGFPVPGPDWPAQASQLHGKKRPPLYQLFRTEFPLAWEAWIAPFFNEAGLMSAYDTLREIIRRFRLAEELPDQAPFLQRLLEIAHLAETRGCSSLAAFLAFWRDCKEDEKLPLPENMDAIRIMTVHKAKGLEFPVVILPFQHRGRQRDPELAMADFGGQRLLTRVTKALPDLHYSSCVTDELERLNLLYVAWTRPIYALHSFITRPASASTPLVRGLERLVDIYSRTDDELCQWETLTDEPDDQPEPEQAQNLTLVEASLCSEKATGADAHGMPLPDVRAFAGKTIANPGTEPLEGWRPMGWLPRLKIYRSTLEGAEFTPKRRGILTHLCLEHLVIRPCPADGSDRAGRADSSDRADGPGRKDSIRKDVRRAVEQGLRLFPLPLETPEEIAHQMEESLFWFACLPEAPLWLAHGLREQGIADEQGNMHRVDLLVDEALYRSDQPHLHLHAIDYKTGNPLAESLTAHKQQVLRYMRLLEQGQDRPVRGTLVYLDQRRLVPVSPSGTDSQLWAMEER